KDRRSHRKGGEENGAGNQTGDVLCCPALERLLDCGRDCLYRAAAFWRAVLLLPLWRQQRQRLDCVVLSLRGRGYYGRGKRVCRYGSRVTRYAGQYRKRIRRLRRIPGKRGRDRA